MLRINPIQRPDWLMLALILLCAAYIRFSDFGIVEFRHDEAMLSLMAQDAADGDFPLTGIPSSVGIPNSPISVYIMAIPYALSSDPLFATAFVAALNVIGVGLLWLLAHRYFGTRIALFAGFAYAFSPWAILYSRKIWAQDFHTPFVLLALLLGLYGFGEGKRWAQVLCLPLFMLALQIHFAALALLPLYAVLLWIGRRQISWPALMISLVLTALTLVPFALGLSQTLDQDPNRVRNALGRGSGLGLSDRATIYTAQLTMSFGFEEEFAPENPEAMLAAVPPLGLWWALLGAAALIGLVADDSNPRLKLFAGLWALLPLVVFTPTWTTVYRHYFIASIPAYCLLIGMGLNWLLNRLPLRPYSQVVFILVFVGAVTRQGDHWFDLLHYVDMEAVSGFGAPLHYLLDVRDELAQHDDVVIVSDGIEILYDQEPAIWSVMLRDTAECVRAVSDGGFAVFPDHPFAAVIASNAPDSALDSHYVNDTARTYPLRPDEGEYTVSAFDSVPEWDGPPLTPITPTRFDNGAQLIGYHLEPNTMFLEWSLPGRVEGDYQYFGHFIDANGEKIGQRDSSFWPGRYWCAGDRLITSIDIALPEGTETLRLGMYRFERGSLVNSSVMDDAGNPISTWVDIPLTPPESQSS